MRKFLRPLICILLIGLPIAGYSQTPDSSDAPADEVTITGCLKQGASSTQFTITDQKSGDTFTVSGSAALSSHVNQTVKVTGEAKGKEFTAKSVTQVAATCSATPRE